MPGSRIALLGAAALAVVVVGLAWGRIARTPGIDYYAAWAASRAVGEGRVENPWSIAGRKQVGRWAATRALDAQASPRERAAASPVLAANRGALLAAGTPFLLTVLGTPSVDDYEADYVFFSLASLILYITSILWLCRQLGYPPVPSLLALSYLAGPFGPYLSGEQVANVHAIQLAIVAALAAAMAARNARRGELAAGALFAAGVAFKPSLLPVALPALVALLVRRRGRTLLAAATGAIAGAGLSFVASALFFGRTSCWHDWVRTLPELVRPSYEVAMGNFSLATVLRTLTGIDVGEILLLVGLGGLLAFEASTAAPRGPASPNPGLPRAELVALVGLGSVVLLWAARLAWLHYFALAAPLLLFVLRPAGGQTVTATRPERRVGIAAAVGFAPLHHLGLPPLALALTMHLALLVFVVLALRILRRSRRIDGTAPV
ncbi:MAG: glycosyltransferase 87 family protein [Thermoanaerobaculia bacterium]